MPRLPELLKRYEIALYGLGYAASSIKSFLECLRHFDRFLKAKQIEDPLHVTPALLDDFRTAMVQLPTPKGLPRRSATVNASLTAVRSFYRILSEADVIPYDPSRRLRMMRQHSRLPPAVLSPDEMAKVLDSIDPSTPRGGRDRAFFEMMYATGARIGEMLGMDVDDVDLSERLARIRHGKGGKERVVPFGTVAQNHLENYLRWVRPTFAGKSTTRALWLNTTSTRLIRVTVRERLQGYLSTLGITKRLTPHGLRHACATHLLKRKADLRHIQELLGHASVEATQVYTHLEVEDLKETLARCHPRERTEVPPGEGTR